MGENENVRVKLFTIINSKSAKVYNAYIIHKCVVIFNINQIIIAFIRKDNSTADLFPNERFRSKVIRLVLMTGITMYP